MVAQGAKRLPVYGACPSAQLNTLRNLCELIVLHPPWRLQEAGVAVCLRVYGMPLQYPNFDVVISDLSSPCVLCLVQAGAPPAGDKLLRALRSVSTH